MNRDGHLTSCWQEMPGYQPRNRYSTDMEFDVVIIGAGITGITAALLLQTAGKKCLVTEARNIGFGTTGGTTAHLNTLLDTPYYTISKNFSEDDAKLVHQAAVEAIDQIRHNVESYDINCNFEEKTGYLFSPRQELDKELEKIVDSAIKAGVDIAYTKENPVPVPFTAVARFSGQGQFHPLKYVYAMAQAFEDAGGVILQQNLVEEVKEADILHVHSSRGIIKTKNVIYATHTPPGINLLHLRLVPWRSYAMAVRINGQYPDAVVYDTEDPYHYFRSQEIDGEMYLIAGGEDHKTGHEENAEKSFTNLEAYLRKHFDIEEIKYKWSSQYYETVDGLPYIGHFPMHPDNVYVATGYGGNGMIYGTISAILLTELIVNGKSQYEKLFDPNRLKPIAGFAEFASAAADVVSNFIKKPFNAEKLEELVDLAPGEGKIVKYEGEKIALYKDEDGKIYGISPTCNHMGCSINWNNAEKSWDCPCHGSRFNMYGEMLNGPAVRDQHRIDIEQPVHHHK
jgi:glycine/D-amino acid oxidase-like deaminating enzyme/nitrite reductase/ring-hydroxylating ferredoxin subunit